MQRLLIALAQAKCIAEKVGNNLIRLVWNKFYQNGKTYSKSFFEYNDM